MSIETVAFLAGAIPGLGLLAFAVRWFGLAYEGRNFSRRELAIWCAALVTVLVLAALALGFSTPAVGTAPPLESDVVR